MQARFLHCADIHLGYQQYNQKERGNDFARAFLAVMDAAIAEQVDFVVLAGDLFQKRAIDALTLNQAVVGLERLQRAGIPCLAVEGNHERAYYDNQIGWMEFLAQRRLLLLLNAPFQEGKAQLAPYTERTRAGAYHDPKPGLRVYGLGWRGSSTAQAVDAYAQALAATPAPGIEYTILIAHAGVEGVIDGMGGGLSHRQWSVLRPHADYVALGHIHKPFEHDNWIFNPGSPETCAIAEAAWPERGYFIVDVDTARAGAVHHRATLHSNPRRRFHRVRLQVDHLHTPADLADACEKLLRADARKHKLAELGPSARPVVELQLTGVLPFDRTSLDLTALEAQVVEICDPLTTLVKNLSRPTEFEVATDDRINRRALERQVVTDLLARDARYRDQSEEWAAVALALKNLAIDGASRETIVDELPSMINRVNHPNE